VHSPPGSSRSAKLSPSWRSSESARSCCSTSVMLGTYKILAFVAFTLFGIGLAFYATPSTLFAFGANLLMVLAAIISIMASVPRRTVHEPAA
jgi:hypothetical protein